jgi:hypothetical protein
VISPRLLVVLAWCWLGLLAGAPLAVAELAHDVGLKRLGEISVLVHSRADRGRVHDLVVAAAADRVEDNPEPLALLFGPSDAAPAHVARKIARPACASAAPLSHRPCAGLPTGPPTAE